MAVERERLYEEVWAEPMLKVAARYGVSSSFMARVCTRLNVPRPGVGYWAQLEVGKAPPKPPLPEALPGDEIEWSRDEQPRRVPRALPQAPTSSPNSVAPSRSTKKKTTHELLLGARDHFEKFKLSDSGYIRPTKRRLVDVWVSKDALDRALDFANSLFLELESGGHRVTFAPLDQHLCRHEVDERSKGERERYGHGLWHPDRATIVYIGTVAIGLTIFEISEEIEVQYVDGKYVPVGQVPKWKRPGPLNPSAWTTKRDVPSGNLCLRASSPYARTTWDKQWRELKKGELRSKIPDIIRSLESDAAHIAKLVEEAARQAEIERREWEAQQERWDREEAERRRRQNIKESREQLFSIIEAWGVAKRIETFFEDADRRAGTLDDDGRVALLERLQRARALIGDADALRRFLSWKAPEERNSTS